MESRILIVLIGVAIISSGCVSGDSGPQENVDSPDEPSESSGQDEVDSEASRTYDINEEFTLGDITYEVTDYKTGQVIGSTYSQEEASGEFVQLAIEVTNNANEPVTFTDQHMRLVDGQDRTYSVQSDVIAVVEDAFLFEELQPGLSESGILLYDVPQNQQDRQLEVSPPSIVSTEDPKYVNLSSSEAGDIEAPEQESPIEDSDTNLDQDFESDYDSELDY